MEVDDQLTALHEAGHIVMALAIAREFIQIRSVTIAQTREYKGIIECADGFDLTLRDHEWQQADGAVPADDQELARIRAKARLLMQVRMAGPVIEMLSIYGCANLQDLFQLPTLRDDASNVKGFLEILPGDASEVAQACWQLTIETMVRLSRVVVYLTRLLLASRTIAECEWTRVETDLTQRIDALLQSPT